MKIIPFLFGAFWFAALAGSRAEGQEKDGPTVLTYDVVAAPDAASGAAGLTDGTIAVLERRLKAIGLAGVPVRRAGDSRIEVLLPRDLSPERRGSAQRRIERPGYLWIKASADDQDRDEIERIRSLKEQGRYDVANEAFDVAGLYRIEHGKGGLVWRKEKERDILLENEGRIPGALIESVRFTRDESFRPAVRFAMSPAGRERLAATTTRLKEEEASGKRGRAQLAFVFDGDVVSFPYLSEPITEGEGLIAGDFSDEEVQEIIAVLKEGPLPAKLVLRPEEATGGKSGK